MCPSVFIVDFEEVSADGEAKEGIDCRKYVDLSADSMWALNKGTCDKPFRQKTHSRHPIWRRTRLEHFQAPCQHLSFSLC